jgi:hypothetical protein
MSHFADESRFAASQLTLEELESRVLSISAQLRTTFTDLMVQAILVDAVETAQHCRDIMVRCQVINYAVDDSRVERQFVWGYLVELRTFTFDYFPMYRDHIEQFGNVSDGDAAPEEEEEDEDEDSESGSVSDEDMPIGPLIE